jgi:hypothetical protein
MRRPGLSPAVGEPGGWQWRSVVEGQAVVVGGGSGAKLGVGIVGGGGGHHWG